MIMDDAVTEMTWPISPPGALCLDGLDAAGISIAPAT
jgi:hypothetical protein